MPTKPIAVPTRAAMAIRLSTVLATPTQSTPAPSMARRRMGNRGTDSGRALSGSERQARAVNSRMIGRLAQNAPRHQSSSAKMPPTMGPIRAATPHTPETSARMRVRSAAG